MSIFVITVGLLGVLALLPIAGRQAEQGSNIDRVAAVGRSAVRDFQIRDMGNPQMWLDSTGGAYSFSGVTAVCIDPRFIATNGSVAGANKFPYVTGANPAMNRITLRKEPSGSAMTAPHADIIFMSRDDLVIEEPADLTSPPVSQLSTGDTQRQYQGKVSWMATLSPKVDRSGNYLIDMYTLSIVVFHRRDSRFTVNNINERLASIPSGAFHSAGYTGGDVTMTDVSLAATEPMKEGDWVMLGGKTGDNIPVFQWYRVLSVGESQGTSRDVTLQGADWNPSVFTSSGGTQATLVDGVAAVYEKTIRITPKPISQY